MPGIVGVVSKQPPDLSARLVGSMAATMKREPFYVSGTGVAAHVHAAWIAHAGSYAARVSSASSDETLVFLSGECVGDGVDPDIAGLYARHGDAFVAHLNGLFAGCLIDRRRGAVVLFNDRYGLERLYVHETTDATYFASEARALLAILPATRALAPSGLAQYLALGCTVGRQTIFEGVELLEGGTLWSFDAGGARRRRYFDPTAWEEQATLSSREFSAKLHDVISRVVPRYLRGDAGIGLSLTGGLDTRMIAACLPPDTPNLRTYTFAGESATLLDEHLARTIAARLGLSHEVFRIGTSFLRDYAIHVDRTVEATDGAFGATGAHEIYLNGLARVLAPVRLTGNFGSEVLRGMSTFKPLRLMPGMLVPELRQSVHRAAQSPILRRAHPVSAAVFSEIPFGLFGSLAAGRSQVTFRTPYLDNDLVELAFAAPAEARQSALPSLEVVGRGRHGLASIPTDRGVLLDDGIVSRLPRRLFSEVTFKLDYLHKDGLPGWLMSTEPIFEVLARVGLLGLHKYLPYRRWFRRELAHHVREVITDGNVTRMGLWDGPGLADMLQTHLDGRRNHVREINAVLTLEAIDRLLLRGSSTTSA